MTEEELRKAIKRGLPPSLEARMEWLEADASAQRTAILRLEKEAKLTCKALGASCVLFVLLTLAVLT
jgi:hypothetical protein